MMNAAFYALGVASPFLMLALVGVLLKVVF